MASAYWDSLSSIHPPSQDLKIHLKGEPLLATPFHKSREGNDTVKIDDLKKVHQQANYTNTILNTIAEQLNHVSIRTEETHKAVKQIPKQIPTYADNISKPFFKMDIIPKKNEESFLEASSSANDQLLKIISD